MSQVELLDNIESEFLDKIQKYIPRLWIKSFGYSAASFHADLTDDISAYKNGQYYYDGNQKFIHWTSLQNLTSIINSREIRLYNLHNSNDPTEFEYAAQKLSIPGYSIEHSKTYLFTFSCCEAELIKNDYLWKVYGRDYGGVGIEFTIENDIDATEKYMLSKVYYEIPFDLISLKKDLDVLEKKYSGAELNIDLGKLLAYHKHPDYNSESEIRLSSYYPFIDDEASITHCNSEFRFDDRPRITEYFPLKLWVNNESAYIKPVDHRYDRRLYVPDDYFIKNPRIKIKNVYFGYNCGISNMDFGKYREKLEEIILYKLGYRVNLNPNLFQKVDD